MRPKKPDDHEDAKAPALSDQAPDVAKEKIPKAEAPHLNVAGARQTGNALKGTKEGKRVEEDRVREKHWKRWGPYLAERQWGTVREDYSADGAAWEYFPHEQSSYRAYRWGEDGIAGLTDNHNRLCFALALWNEKDPLLKERLFGLSNLQGNHGEDVKEQYWYLDSTPTHSYMKMLYKYPQRAFPYTQLVEENAKRDQTEGEYEILDTGVFEDNRYWDVFVEYAKEDDLPEALFIRVTVYNRGPEPATLHIIPQLFFRNTWAWKEERSNGSDMPSLHIVKDGDEGKIIDKGAQVIQANHSTLGTYWLTVNDSPAPSLTDKECHRGGRELRPEMLFTDNDTNMRRLTGGREENQVPFVKDAFHDHIIPEHREKYPDLVRPEAEENGDAGEGKGEGEGESSPNKPTSFVNPEQTGTKAGAHYKFENIPANGGCATIRIKLSNKPPHTDPTSTEQSLFDEVVSRRISEADEFYDRLDEGGSLSSDLKMIMRQALAGMLWSKQFYHYVQKDWMKGDPGQPEPPKERRWGRNKDWRHIHMEDVLSMPDKWEYPWFATWDSAFHCVPLALVDPTYAKGQLELFTREWYMKPDGALPAYEWDFSDVNPPVHAWATFKVYKIERLMWGREDIDFLERVFQKLLLNFTWWVNRKDAGGSNLFEGGFLGLDNIGIFDRSQTLPTGGVLRQADATAWMAFFSLCMLNMALELAKLNRNYQDIASKFFEHFLFISDALTFKDSDDNELTLWNDKDGFFYDAIDFGQGNSRQLPIRSLVGLMPLYATLTLEPTVIDRFPGFKKRMEWFIENRSEMAGRNIADMSAKGQADRRLLALTSQEQLRKIMGKMLDEEEFLSGYGIRSVSRYHEKHPFEMEVDGQKHSVTYWPGDSQGGMFGGNSNWRGPIWLPTTFLLIESVYRFYQFYGDDFKVECPSGSGKFKTLADVGDEIQRRVIHIFARDENGIRAFYGENAALSKDPNYKDLILFNEFFHADTGKGLGASHQTGWTGLVAYMIWQIGHLARLPRANDPSTSAKNYFAEDIELPNERVHVDLHPDAV